MTILLAFLAGFVCAALAVVTAVIAIAGWHMRKVTDALTAWVSAYNRSVNKQAAPPETNPFSRSNLPPLRDKPDVLRDRPVR